MDPAAKTRYTARFQVRTYDLDAWGDLPAARIAAYFEQAAWEASADRGFDETWYREHGTAWVIHRLTLARLGPIEYRDAVTADTWISSMGRVRSSREYELRCAEGPVVAAGRADWVYVDRYRQVPKALDPVLPRTFTLGVPTPLLVPAAAADPLPAPARPFTATRRAYRYEADSMGHVNNTIYLAWLDEALADALAAAGLPLAPAGGPGLRLRGRRYVVDYRRSARPGDTLTIRSVLSGTADGGRLLEWSQEIVRDAGDEPLVQATSQQELLGVDVNDLTPDGVVATLLTPAQSS